MTQHTDRPWRAQIGGLPQDVLDWALTPAAPPLRARLAAADPAEGRGRGRAGIAAWRAQHLARPAAERAAASAGPAG